MSRRGTLYGREISTPNKTGDVTLFALASITASTVSKSSDIDVAGKLGCFITIHFGRKAATAGTAGVNFIIEGSPFTTGDDNWAELAKITTNFAAVEAEAVTGTVAAGASTITCASTTNLTAQTKLFILNSTIGNSEWRIMKSLVTNTSVTVIDPLTNAQTGSTMYAGAEIYGLKIGLGDGIMRLRLVIEGSLFTQDFAAKATISYLDSIV